MQIGIGIGLSSLSASPAWTPAANWPGAASPGWWLDPTTFADLYQDSAGTSPATAVEQPGGLTLDKRLGLVLGSENFADASVVFSGESTRLSAGVYRLYSSAGVYTLIDRIAGAFVPAAGRAIRIAFTIDSVTVAGAGVTFEGAQNAPTIAATIGPKSCIVFAAGAATIGLKRLAGATDIQISGISARELPGNHFPQASAPARPIIKLLDGVQCLSFDALDDSVSTGPTTFGASMDVFLAVRRTSATGALLFETAGGTKYLGAMDATAGPASSGAGTPAYLVNGVAVPGGTGATRAQLAAAVPIGDLCVVEIRNADLSAWTAMGLGAYAALPMGMGFAQGICCPAGDAAARARNRRFAGAKVGIAL